ncbi:MAG: hypothetical protein E7053_09570 [Lentisphaerae bacterium]|nr:hypothetical protein [Lentisphaerota bacterium]MBE6365975.1 hypothetical protein [Lentisphaerota bacterium]
MNKKESALPHIGKLKQDTQQGNGVNIIHTPEDFKLHFEYFQRFKLQHDSQNLLFDQGLIHDKSQYYNCHRNYFASIVSLMRNPDSNRAYYDGIVTCSNSKACPVCAPRIMGKRSAEIRTAVWRWLNLASENTCYMLTLTFAHKITDSLEYLLKLFSMAVQIFWANGSVKRLFNRNGYRGRITSLEIQYSRHNGFHPHQHILFFSRKSMFDIEKLRHFWLSALSSVGLSGLSDIALDLIEARSAENYLTKISSEMALGNLKQGRGINHYSPMQLLAEVGAGYVWAKDVWCEYFKATKGIHSLYWSKHLKAFFGINEVSDNQIASGVTDHNLQRFLDFPAYYFRRLSVDHKATLRKYAAFNQWDKASALLDELNIIHWKEYSEQLL